MTGERERGVDHETARAEVMALGREDFVAELPRRTAHATYAPVRRWTIHVHGRSADRVSGPYVESYQPPVRVVSVSDLQTAIGELEKANVEPKPLASDYDEGHHRGWLAAFAAMRGRLDLDRGETDAR